MRFFFLKKKQKSTIKTPESEQRKINTYLEYLRNKQTLNNGTDFKFYSAIA